MCAHCYSGKRITIPVGLWFGMHTLNLEITVTLSFGVAAAEGRSSSTSVHEHALQPHFMSVRKKRFVHTDVLTH